MKSIRQPFHGRPLSLVLTLLAVGAVGGFPWQGAFREARACQDEQAPVVSKPDRAELAEARLVMALAEEKIAQAEQNVAEKAVVQHEAEIDKWDAQVKWWKHLDELEKDRYSESLRESRAKLTLSLADRDEAKATLGLRRASLDAATAAVREAEVLRDIARASLRGEPVARAESDLKKTQATLRARRHARDLAERDAARAGINWASAKLANAEAEVGRWKTEVERLEREVGRTGHQFDVLLQSRDELKVINAAWDASKAQVGLAQAHLEAAEARLKLTDFEAGAASRAPTSPYPATPR
jgi:chromosome segregation ATPase